MHYGLRLPGSLSSLGKVGSVSVSNWAPVKSAHLLRQVRDKERVTHWSKLEQFNLRAHLQRPNQIRDEDLSDLSFYAFWRQYEVVAGRLVRKRCERMVAVNGTGWPREAATSHAHHAEYARKTLYAYAPCQALEGTEYLDRCCKKIYGGSWARFLAHFCRCPVNKWCPPWIKHNYEMKNREREEAGAGPRPTGDPGAAKTERGEPPTMPSPTGCAPPETATNGGAEQPADPREGPVIPYASKTPKYLFEDLPEASGEPDKEEDPDDPEELDADHHGHWRKENLTKGQMLSGAGPSGTRNRVSRI